MERAGELAELVAGSAWLRAVLRTVAHLELPDCWVGAGVVRDLVWGTRFGTGFDPAIVKDVDVVYFDPVDLIRESELAAEGRLQRERPDVEWDVKNQARVHLWFEARFGTPAEPLHSTAEGVATWPELATCVAIRARGDEGDEVEILAPYGLDDLLDGVWRRNPTRVTDSEYRGRIARKHPELRWPRVTVIE